jgi:hypothetical protein
MLASDSIFVMSEWCDAFVGFVACLLLGVVSWQAWRGGCLFRMGMLAGVCVAAWMAFSLDHSVLRLILVAWVVGLAWLGEAGVRGAQELRPGPSSCLLPVHLAALGCGLALGVYERSSWVWFAARDVVGMLGPGGLGGLGLSVSSLGVWVSGLPIYGFGMLAVVAAIALYGARLGHLIQGGILVAGFLAVEATLGLASPVTAVKVSVCQLASLTLVAVLVACACRRAPGSASGSARASRTVFAVSLLLTVAGLLAAGLPPLSRPAEPARLAGPEGSHGPGEPSVLLYPRGFLDWRVPDFDQVGLVNAGMFGLFRRSLERQACASGGRVTVADEAISVDDLARVGVVVVINPTEGLGKVEVEALERFVQAGGGLLVLGDHTNIGGSMEHLNSILAFTGIRFNFDSAIPMRPHWRGCLEVRKHAVTRALGGGAGGLGRRLVGDLPVRCPSEDLLQVAVGASLAIKPPAVPLVVGRYGFADAGDSLNGGPGAYMGNLTQGRGESAGDVVLVAAEELGRGRVLVFGDTSPFQNGALFLSQRLVSNAVQWVASGTAAPAALAPEPLRYADDIALVDFSRGPRASLSLFETTSLGGLANCLARVGVAAAPVFSPAGWNCDARYLFLTSPTRLTREDSDRLTAYLAEGGNVILAQGYSAPQPCEELLSRFGLAIENLPLGNGDPGAGVAHKDAWAISCRRGANQAAPDTTVRACAFGHPTVVTSYHWQGSFTLISDARLLLDENLEGEQRAERRNIAFVRDLIEALRAHRGNLAGKGREVGYANTGRD